MINQIKKRYWKFRYSKFIEIKAYTQSLICELKTLFKRSSNNYEHHSLDNELIISLTSYPPRFSKLHLTLKTLITQSVKADTIILWLARNDATKVPKKVRNLEEKGLITIKFCEDLGPGKKIIPAVRENPDRFIVTADDDICYPSEWLSKLVEAHHKNADNKLITAHRVHRIKMCDRDIMPYSEWTYCIDETSPHPLNLLTGGGGALFTPNCFNEEMVNSNNYRKLALKQDDLWIHWMLKLNHYSVIPTGYKFELVCWNSSQAVALFNDNYEKNNTAIRNLVTAYGLPLD